MPVSEKKKRYCFLCGELGGDVAHGVFSVSDAKFASWVEIIPNLKRSANLCDRHFDEKDIVKGYYIGKDFIAAERWKLLKTAYPKHYLGIYQIQPIVDHYSFINRYSMCIVYSVAQILHSQIPNEYSYIYLAALGLK